MYLVILCSLVFSTKSLHGSEEIKLHPGHLLPMGHPSAGQRVSIEERDSFPTPQQFFAEFVRPLKPLLMKGVFTETRAARLWDDDYLRNAGDAEKTMVTVESKRESTTMEVYNISLKMFLDHYQEIPIYLTNKVPEQLQSDVPIPECLQCRKLFPHIVINNLWMSSGGTVGLLHLDHYDNINCLLRGTKHVVIVDQRKYPGFILDKTDRAFVSIDVDAVDYIKHPHMAAVKEFTFANMSAGDCIYIPFNIGHQVRSFGRNLAVNIFIGREAANEDVSGCPDSLASLADIHWDDVRRQDLKDSLKQIVRDGNLTLFNFWQSHSYDTTYQESLFARAPRTWEPRAKSVFTRRIFNVLDVNGDGEIRMDEVDALKPQHWDEIQKGLEEANDILEEARSLKKRKEDL